MSPVLHTHSVTKQLRIAVIAPTSPAEFFGLIWKGVWSAARELSPFGVCLETYETEGHDIAVQRRILVRLLKSRPDAVAIVPAHLDDLNEEIGRVALAGIPVITFHTDAPRSRRETYVGTDPLQSGTLACELLGKLMRGQGAIASFPGAFETENMATRYLAFREELGRNWPGITETICHIGADGVRDAALRAFREKPEIAGIYVGSSRVHLVGEVMEELGISVPCVGFDKTETVRRFLARGTVAGVIDESPYQQGYLAIQQAFQSAQGLNSEKCSWLRIPSDVVLSASSPVPFSPELLMKSRTLQLRQCQQALAEARARIVSMEETDPLTGLLNRRRFEEVLEQHTRNHQPLTILMARINGLQRTSGGPGPHVSDEALASVARVLQSESRPQDFCSRLGGDEFCVLLPGDSHSEAIAMKERISARLAEIVIAPLTLRLGIQIRVGIASMPADAVNAEDLLVIADNAMYTDQRTMAIRQLSVVSSLSH
jgi:diguanylate cyclase (GGDEF)-like protein